MLGPKLVILIVIVAMLATGVYIADCSHQSAQGSSTGETKCEYAQKVHDTLEDIDSSMGGGAVRR